MRVVYLAHALSAPTREGIEANRARGARWGAWVAQTYRCAVIADWLWMTGQLEETPDNRALGLSCDFEFVRRADEVWLVGARISEGMALEAAEGFRHMKPVFDYTCMTQDNEPPAVDDMGILTRRRFWLPENEG